MPEFNSPDGYSSIAYEKAHSMAQEIRAEEYCAHRTAELEEQARTEIVKLDEHFANWLRDGDGQGDGEPLLDVQRLLSLLLQPWEPADKAATILARIVRDYQDHVLEREGK